MSGSVFLYAVGVGRGVMLRILDSRDGSTPSAAPNFCGIGCNGVRFASTMDMVMVFLRGFESHMLRQVLQVSARERHTLR